MLNNNEPYDNDFVNYVKEVTDHQISELTDEKISDLKEDFEVGKLANELSEKVCKEYTEFIDDTKKHDAGYIIEMAYEIVWKDNINQFIENEPPCLSKKEYVALLSAKNTLHELYVSWLSNGELHTYDDIEVLLGYAAGDILVSMERESKQHFSVVET